MRRDFDFIGSSSDLTSNDIYFHGPNAVNVNGGNPLQVYSPPTYSPGSSISHLNDPDLVMYYAVAAGEEKRSYSSIELAILMDLGWDLTAEGLLAIPEPNTVYLSLCVFLVLLCQRQQQHEY